MKSFFTDRYSFVFKGKQAHTIAMANFMGQGTVPVSQASSAATSLQTTSQLPPKIENYNFMTDVDFKYKMSHR